MSRYQLPASLTLIALTTLLILLGAAYYFFDPAEAAWMPKCLWKSLTGTDCPGCGSQRMAHALLHGDIAGAWRANAFAVVVLPFIPFLIWLEKTRKRHWRLYAALHRPASIYILLALILAWWLLRNLGGAQLL